MQTLPIAQAKGPKTDSGQGKKSADGQADFERDVGKQPVKPFIFRGQPLRNGDSRVCLQGNAGGPADAPGGR